MSNGIIANVQIKLLTLTSTAPSASIAWSYYLYRRFLHVPDALFFNKLIISRRCFRILSKNSSIFAMTGFTLACFGLIQPSRTNFFSFAVYLSYTLFLISPYSVRASSRVRQAYPQKRLFFATSLTREPMIYFVLIKQPSILGLCEANWPGFQDTTSVWETLPRLHAQYCFQCSTLLSKIVVAVEVSLLSDRIDTFWYSSTLLLLIQLEITILNLIEYPGSVH